MEETNTTNNHRKKIAAFVFVLVAAAGALTLYFYLSYKATHITTDDAYIDGNVLTIASKVAGTVKEVHVRDNQAVKKGDLLLEIDPADYKAKVKEKTSEVNTEKAKLFEIDAKTEAAKRKLAELKAAAESAKANLELQEATLRQAESDIKRAEALFKKEAISKERLEKTKTAYDVSAAQVKAAKEQLNKSEMSIETQKAVVKQSEASRPAQISTAKQKEATVETAELNYGYTKIYAPSDGHITKKSVQVGNQIQPGQPLMAVVPLEGIYVTANYKETQLDKVKPGQKVEIKVDTYSGKKFTGRVESIMAGSGAAFSLFPPENATGNFVKIVQRIPVKILLDKDADPQHVLRIGMSVEPTVIIEK